MMIKGLNPENVKFGNSFTRDGLAGMKFDYMLANPPFGVEWKKEQEFIEKEHDQNGLNGRFGAGLPRINDGSLLFLQHMISKMKPEGSRIAIVFNGSPLFTGGAGSGESEIRKWIIESDWLEAIVALPEQIFYNTGISTYVWIVTNRKRKERRGKIQLVNATDLCRKMSRSLGNKRNELSDSDIELVTRIYGDFEECERSKIFDNLDFGYRQIVVERPLRLAFRVTSRRIDRLRDESSFIKLATSKKKGKEGQREIEDGTQLQSRILDALGTMDCDKTDKNLEDFKKRLDCAVESAGVTLTAQIRKVLIAVLSERDETADICCNASGHAEPDPEFREYENVPMKENIHAYFEREVKPHAPDAWIDESKTRTGYDIPMNKYFYQYIPPRAVNEIQDELTRVEQEIVKLLTEAAG
jgi:type I restriction enzyme M protein